jgi:hypothetical protein
MKLPDVFPGGEGGGASRDMFRDIVAGDAVSMLFAFLKRLAFESLFLGYRSFRQIVLL